MARRYERDEAAAAKAMYLRCHDPREVARRLTATTGVSTPEALVRRWAEAWEWATTDGEEGGGLPFDVDEEFERLNRQWEDYEAAKQKGLERVGALDGVPALRAARMVDIAIRGQRSIEEARIPAAMSRKLFLVVKEDVSYEGVLRRIAEMLKQISDEYR